MIPWFWFRWQCNSFNWTKEWEQCWYRKISVWIVSGFPFFGKYLAKGLLLSDEWCFWVIWTCRDFFDLARWIPQILHCCVGGPPSVWTFLSCSKRWLFWVNIPGQCVHWWRMPSWMELMCPRTPFLVLKTLGHKWHLNCVRFPECALRVCSHKDFPEFLSHFEHPKRPSELAVEIEIFVAL